MWGFDEELQMIGRLLKGLYKIYDQVGSGGLATVYLARNVRTNQIVAVKVLHEHVATAVDTRARFEREVKLLAGLDDPHFVRLYDHGQEGSQPFLVMEFVEGSTLKSILEGNGPLSVPQALYVARQVAEALSGIHSRNVVHRDIKPQNVMVRPDGTVKVMDFGVAKAVDVNSLTQTGFMIGTPYYLSPEQGVGQPIDHRSDLYSLGVLLYEMLTGRVLFDGDSPVAIVLKHVHEPVPSDWAERGNIPSDVAALVDRCLRKRPEERYGSALELVAAIDRVMAVHAHSTTIAQDLGALVNIVGPDAVSPSRSTVLSRTERVTAQAIQEPSVHFLREPPSTVQPKEVVEEERFPWFTFAVFLGRCCV